MEIVAVIIYDDNAKSFEAFVNEGRVIDPNKPQGVAYGHTPEDAFSIALADWSKQSGGDF
jgi:hypothetical protein